MDQHLEKQLIRQLKILNTWITIFGTLMLIILGIIGFFLYQTAMFVKTSSDKLTDFQKQTSQQLDIKSRVCSGNDSFANFVKSAGACN